jgi:hypothetical protein
MADFTARWSYAEDGRAVASVLLKLEWNCARSTRSFVRRLADLIFGIAMKIFMCGPGCSALAWPWAKSF